MFGFNFRKISLGKFFVILFVVFLAGIFLFGGKVQGIVAGKLMVKGNFYFNGGAYDLEKAAKFYKVAAFVDGKASYPHYQLARVLFVKADFENARAEIDRALVLNPDHKRAYYIRGLIDGYAGNWKASQDDFQKFVDWAPKEWAGYNDLAWAYYEDKEYQKAADAASKGLEFVPENAWLLNGLGVSLQALGESEKAKAALDKSVEIAKNMTLADWKGAYPGNDAQTAEWDLAQFRTDVNFNLQLAANPFSSGTGEFQAACGSSEDGTCAGGGWCVPCDPYHDIHGVPLCGLRCGNVNNYDCACGPPPFNPGCNPNTGACHFSSCEMSGGGDYCYGQGSGSKCCEWRSACGVTQCALTDPCAPPPTNHNPTVSISSPSNGATDVPTIASFAASITDADAGDALTYSQTLTCGGSPQTINNPASGSGTSPINLSFTQALPAGASCTWTINANDNHSGSDSGQSTFTVASTPPLSCTLSCPESVIIPPGGTDTFCSVSGSGCTMQNCTTQIDNGPILDGSPSVSGNSCQASVETSAGYESTAVIRAMSNDGQTDDVTIFVRRIGWIEVNP